MSAAVYHAMLDMLLAMERDRSQNDWRDQAWRLQAACRGLDVRTFFLQLDDGEESPMEAAERQAAAMQVCSTCRVSVQCLRYAIHNNEEHGIWGGLDTAHRVRLAKAISKMLAGAPL